jgi:beta-glucosidase
MENRTYRYVKDNENILYPFGYGLTYSKVECTNVEYSDGTAAVTVTNSGENDTEDVVQLYIKGYSENAVKNYSLCGFKRVSLAKGETKTIEIKLSDSAFTAVNNEGERVSGGDKFTLYAGTAQPDEISMNLTGTKSVSVDIKF